MPTLMDLMTLAKQAKEAGNGLTLDAEQTALLVDELTHLLPPPELLADELFNHGEGLTMGEILESPEIGSWADLDIGDSAEYVSQMRRRKRKNLTW